MDSKPCMIRITVRPPNKGILLQVVKFLVDYGFTDTSSGSPIGTNRVEKINEYQAKVMTNDFAVMAEVIFTVTNNFEIDSIIAL